MTFALIVNTIKESINGNNVTTDAIDTTGANLIVLFAVNGNTGPITPTDSKGNTWIPLTTNTGGNVYVKFWYCVDPIVGSGHTFTLLPGGGNWYPSIAVAAFSGSHSVPFDVQNGFVNLSTTSIQPGSVTPSEDNELIVFGLVSADGGVVAVDIGSITGQVDGTFNVAFPVALAYEIQTSAVARNPTWSWTPTAFASARTATFKSEPSLSGGAVQSSVMVIT